LLGGLHYQLLDDGSFHKVWNVIYEAIPSVGLQKIYSKRLLPNYDIFDEEKYFTPGEGNTFYQFADKTFALLICEDMWASSVHDFDPCQEMIKEIQQKN